MLLHSNGTSAVRACGREAAVRGWTSTYLYKPMTGDQKFKLGTFCAECIPALHGATAVQACDLVLDDPWLTPLPYSEAMTA